MDYVILWFDGDVPSGGNVDFHCDVYPAVERAAGSWLLSVMAATQTTCGL
jgi:hypothetical protein